MSGRYAREGEKFLERSKKRFFFEKKKQKTFGYLRATALTAAERMWLVLEIGLWAAGLWLAGPLPVAHVGGIYDDYLFVRLANFLLHGQWLGPYDALTLAKGPFYPIFLASAAALGVPVQVATELVYLVGALVLSRCVGQLAGSRAVGTAALALLAFNPACFEWSTTTLMREPLYCGLTLLVLGLAARLFLCGGGVVSGLALGGAASAFWLTREEGLILVPPLALMAAWDARAGIRHAWTSLRSRRWPAMGAQIWRITVPTGTALLLVLAVCAVNWREYGVFRTNEFQSGPFARAYGALTRIVPDHWQQLTPISRDMRMRAYEASPAMRELQPYLEGDAAHFTTDVACSAATRAYCHDIPGASFMWAFRDAVARTGHHGSAHDADRFYRRLAREIDAACLRKTFRCTARHSGFLPPLSFAYAAPVLRSLETVAMDIVRLGDPSPTIIFSPLQGPLTPAYDTLTFGTRISPPQRLAFAQGWQLTGGLSAADPATRVAIAPASGGAVQAEIHTTPDPGAAAAMHRQSGEGTDFGADVRCEPAACRLELVDGARVLGDWPLAAVSPGTLLNTADATLQIASVSPLASYADRETMPNLRRAIILAACSVMPILSMVGAPLALIIFVTRIVTAWRRRALDATTLLGASLLLTAGLRVVVLALLDATTTTVQFRYMSPAMGPLLCFIAAMLGVELIGAWRDRVRSQVKGARPRPDAEAAPGDARTWAGHPAVGSGGG